MTKKAEEDFLEALHNALAIALADRIKSGEATPADLNVARQFLKDNNISVVPRPNTPMGDLIANLPFDIEGVPKGKAN